MLEAIAFKGRESEYIDQKSGVSARLSIAARELLISQVEQRIIKNPSLPPVPRVLDCYRLAPAITGKVELVYEGEQEGPMKVARHLIGGACRMVFDEIFPDAIAAEDDPSLSDEAYRPVLEWFSKGQQIDLQDEMPQEQYASALLSVPGLKEIVSERLPGLSDEESLLAMELVLEALYQHSLISKLDIDHGASYGDMLRSMLGSV